MKFTRKAEGAGTGGEHYIRLKDGESVEGVFAGEVFEFRTHWVETAGKKSTTLCTGKGCSLCGMGNKSSFRFRINFVVRGTDGLVAKIFEQGISANNLIADLIEAKYDLETTKVKIARKGSGMNDTEYTIMPLPNGALDVDKLKAVRAVKLHDLNPQMKQDVQPQAEDMHVPF